MPRLSIVVDDATWPKLRESAQAALRDPRRQAEFLIKEALERAAAVAK